MDSVPQAAKILSNELSSQQEQIYSFVGDTPDPSIKFQNLSDPTFCADALPHDDLATFLSRPVLIHELTWTEGTPLADTSILPWHLFFDHAPIKKKVDNYAFIACNLHVKAVINASPFYYGALAATYQPLPAFSRDIGEISDARFINYSQRPHMLILPQNNQGGEMELPFFYYKNWLELGSAADLQAMGKITFVEFVDLANANGVSAGVITIQFYAWATDVRITGPTYALAVQSGKPKRTVGKDDEYGKGPVSKVASTVAAIASKLTAIPVIEPFAKATEIGASAVAGIAALFGYTNVPVIDNVSSMKNLPFHSLASTEIGEPVAKLTLDPKNELTIDPRTTGLTGGDELSICYLNCKETMLAVTNWASTAASNALLFSTPVTPVLFDPVIDTNQTRMALTPMCLVAQMFKYWRGDIVFRIKAICTQYHKGRIRITWDPRGDITTNSDTNTTSFTRVVDLAPDLDMEIRISYLQARHWLDVKELGVAKPYRVVGDVFTNNATATNDNGMFNIRVLNELSSPVSTSTVQLMIFVRGAENLEYMDPAQNLDNTYSYFEVQSGKEVQLSSCDSIATGNPAVMHPEASKVYGGEEVRSLRVLMRRANNASSCSWFQQAGGSTSNYTIGKLWQTKYPDPNGYDPAGSDEATGLTSTLVEPYNFSYNTCFTMLVPCFVGMRGSMMWHYNFDVTNSDFVFSTLRVDRIHGAIPNSLAQVIRVGAYGTSAAVDNGLNSHSQDRLPSGATGMALTNQNTQTGFSFLTPHYFPFRFCGTDPGNWNRGTAVDGTDQKYYETSVAARPTATNDPLKHLIAYRMYSIGPDFSVFFFLNVPTLYKYDSAPVYVDS